MKPSANLQQAGDAPVDGNPAFGRLSYARHCLQERALASAVAANNAQHLTTFHLEADVLERPELFDRVAGADRDRTRRATSAALRQKLCVPRVSTSRRAI